MIDAIRPIYSSIHDGRGQNLNHSQGFDRSVRGLGDRFVGKKANVKTPQDWGAIATISSFLGMSCLIPNILICSEIHDKKFFSIIKESIQSAMAIAGLSLILFGFFKIAEKTIIDN